MSNEKTWDRAEAAESRLARLEEALKEIDFHIGLETSNGTEAEIRRVARAALTHSTPPRSDG
jgi:hypothetical protein